MTKRERSSIVTARLQILEEGIDKLCLAAETCQQGDVEVAREAGIAPALDGNAADEAETPAPTPKRCFEGHRRVQ